MFHAGEQGPNSMTTQMDLSVGWVTCQGKARCTESAETVDKSLPPAQQKKKTQSLSHDTRGGREEAPPVWMMYGVDSSLRLGF